jgi:predicted MPP superfamily phosphohydrolase
MSAEEIRRYVAIANQLKGDLVVLTGDFLTYDPSAEGAVVQALSALKAHLAFSAASATMRFTLILRIPSRVSSRLAGLVDYPSRFGSRPEITVFELVREV